MVSKAWLNCEEISFFYNIYENYSELMKYPCKIAVLTIQTLGQCLFLIMDKWPSHIPSDRSNTEIICFSSADKAFPLLAHGPKE